MSDSEGTATDALDAPTREVVALVAPRDGVPHVVATPAALQAAADALASGTGPVAVDAERASGYRYGQRAYLVQLRRAGSGTHLVDPIAVPDLAPLAEALAGTEWVLHAASQDLPCLREIGLEPASLFDTELAGRLLGFPRVGLAALLEEVLGYSLAKEHSAADWSTRPLPEPWLRYAALDVELLVELRDALEEQLVEQGKLAWARQEFDAARDAAPAPPRVDPWRRTSGVHKLRRPRQLAVVRALWLQRDAVAQRRDVSPGRILPDSSIVAAATAATAPGFTTLESVQGFTGRGARRHMGEWQAAVDGALALPDSALPAQSVPSDGPPPPRAWADKDPDAAARLACSRRGLAAAAERAGLPLENLVSPDLARRILWQPPVPADDAGVSAALRAGGARPWQIEQVLPVLLEALAWTAEDERARTTAIAEEAVAEDTTGPVETPNASVVR
ncbi:MAG: HRDC domain-containing protein [Candidatus Nanopelagicales bacterium]